MIERFNNAQKLLEDAAVAADFADDDPEFQQELDSCLATLENVLDAFEIESWFSDPYDDSDAIITINPGQGGLEAQDWTEMLYRMYTRYAENKGWKTTVLDLVPGEGIGLDRVSFQVEGKKRVRNA